MRLRYQNQDIFKSRNIKNEEYKYDKKEKKIIGLIIVKKKIYLYE